MIMPLNQWVGWSDLPLWQQFLRRGANVLVQMLPGMALALTLFLLLRPWRKTRLRKRGLVSGRMREIALELFWLYCGGLAALLLMPDWYDFEWILFYPTVQVPFFRLGSVNLVPFQTWEDPLVFLGNLLVLIPFGFFAALLWRGSTWRRALVLGFVVSLFVECWQLLVGRAFDIDDLLLNTIGAMLGYGLWRLLRRACPGVAKKFHCRRAVVEPK